MPRRAAALLLALAAALPAGAGWRWSRTEGFVEDPEVRAPESPKSAADLAAAGEFAAAARRYAALAAAADADLEAKYVALLRCGDAWLRDGDWIQCYDAFEDAFALAPSPEDRTRVRRFQLDAAILGVREGGSLDWLGFRGKNWAEKQATAILDAWGYEDFSLPGRIRLGEALLARALPEKAIPQFEWVLAEHRDSAWGPRARFALAEAWIAMHTGVVYDPEPLDNARRNLRMYLDEYPDSDDVEKVHARLRTLDEAQAHKDFLTAEHYRGRGKWRSARLYYREVVDRYPLTSWAERARELLPEIEKKVARLPKQEREK